MLIDGAENFLLTLRTWRSYLGRGSNLEAVGAGEVILVPISAYERGHRGSSASSAVGAATPQGSPQDYCVGCLSPGWFFQYSERSL